LALEKVMKIPCVWTSTSKVRRREERESAYRKRRFPYKAIIVVMLLSTLAAGFVGCGKEITYDVGDVETEIFAQINSIRLQHGLVQLSWGSELGSYARYHAQEMLETEKAWHDTRYLSMRNLGEIAYYSALGRRMASESAVAADAVQAWMDSPGHRAVILKDGITEAGAGFAHSGSEFACSFEVR
jgi:uncharacterized protein YkwD